MKTKLLRIFTLLFAVSSMAALIAPPVYADKASDEAAVKLIVACKNFVGPVAAGTDCDKYRTCLGNDQSETCKSVRNLNGNTPGYNNEFITGCVGKEKTRTECVNAMASCYANRVADGKITNEKATECNNLVKEAKLADANSPTDSAAGEEKTTCVVEGIGWIVCPIVTFLSKIVDAAYGFVSSLLVVQPLLTTGESKAIYDAWSIMRNFANVAFVIAFIIIIFSQLTSVGITNYGIKKLLPRIIIAAILVNVSYWICAIAVDISNLLGASINGLFETLGAQMKLPSGGAFSGGGWVGIAGGILAGTAVAAAALYVGLSALIPALITAALAIITVVIVLSVRQALIILLVIAAPLAFVAYLLPNTESWFNKWRGLFQTLLLMYPIIAGMFGASALASQIIMATATGDWKIAIQIMGALVAVAPLALTPLVMKTAGGVLGKVGAFVNNPNRGPADRLRKRAGQYRDRRQNIANARRLEGTSAMGAIGDKIRGDGSSRFRRAAAFTARGAGLSALGEKVASNRAVANLTREQQNAAAEQASKHAAQSYVANRVANEAAAGDSDYANKIAGPTGDVSKVTAAAIAAQVREFNEAVAAEKATMSKTPAKTVPGGPQGLHDIVQDQNASEARRAAAAGQLMKTGSDNDIHDLLDYLGTQQRDASGNFKDSAMASIQQQVGADMGSRKPSSLGAGDMAGLNKGDYDGNFASKIEKRLSSGKFSAESLANTSADELDKILTHIQTNNAALKANPQTAAAMAALENDIAEFRTNPQLQGKQPSHEIASRMDSIHGAL